MLSILASTPPQAQLDQLEILSFHIGAEEYAVDIQDVQELRGHDIVTRIANTAPHVLGVMNLRGTVVPVVDLRVLLGRRQAVFDSLTVIVILKLDERVYGIVVDAVSDVAVIPDRDIKMNPLTALETGAWFTGICELQGRLLQLVSMRKLLASIASSLPPTTKAGTA